MNKNQKYVIQSHTRLAEALAGMARAIWNKEKPTDLEKDTAFFFQEESNRHLWLARVVGDTFVVIR